MTVCPIALVVHCTGCPLVKFCPAKTILGDFGKHQPKDEQSGSEDGQEGKEKEQD